ncbi:hypothetical protein LCGC14_1321200, partial [marine sediment metagenome]
MASLFNDTLSEYLEVNSSPLTAYPFSISCWFNTDAPTQGQSPLFIGDRFVEARRAYLSVRTNSVLRYTLNGPGGSTNPETVNTVSANTWHHAFGASASASDHKVILDGDTGNKGTDATDVGSGVADWDRTSIGRLGDSTPSFYFSGKIAECAIWNVALTDEEAAILSKGFSPLLVRPQNLVAYWPLFRGEDADALNDRVGGLVLAATGVIDAVAHPDAMFRPAHQIIGRAAAVGGVTVLAALATATVLSPDAAVVTGAMVSAILATATALSPISTHINTVSAPVATATALSPVSIVSGVASIVGALATASALSWEATTSLGALVVGALGTATAQSYVALHINTVLASLSTAITTSWAATIITGGDVTVIAALATATALSYAATHVNTILVALPTATALSYTAAFIGGATIAGALSTATALSFDAAVIGGATIVAALSAATALSWAAAINPGITILAVLATATALAYAALVSVLADTTVYASANSLLYRQGICLGPVWIDVNTAYIFYVDGSADLVYQKTTDGGATWATAVSVKTGTLIKVSVWYDKWTPGNAGTLIHIAYTEADGDDLLYRNLDTLDDSLSTEVTVFTGASFTDGNWDTGAVDIVRARGGNLYIGFWGDAGGEFGFYRSTDTGATWTSRAQLADGNEADGILLMPGDETDKDDIWCIYWDRSDNALSLKVYDNSGDSWSESTIVGSVVDDNT